MPLTGLLADMTTPVPVAARKTELLPLLLSILITLGIGVSASLVTRPQIAGWYQALHKPGFTPPPWLFGPVWTVLYVMMAVAAYHIWQRRSFAPVYLCSKASYFTQLLFNALWSVTFFSLHQTGLALCVILALGGSIIGCIVYFSRIYRPAAWLLAPYLLWVGYATALNAAIWVMN